MVLIPSRVHSCRTSHEVRGLKLVHLVRMKFGLASHLTRGAWIETMLGVYGPEGFTRRTSHEVRGLKLHTLVERDGDYASHLTRGAWIETLPFSKACLAPAVAPHTRCVD